MMDDAQEEIEFNLMKRLQKARDEMENTIYAINELSECTKISASAWEAFVHDDLPDSLAWDEKVNDKAASDRRLRLVR